MSELNIEFGCGGNREYLPGDWIATDLAAGGPDIRQPLPYADFTVDNIRAEHVLEHVTAPDGLRFLMECYRVLKHGGKLRICVPNLSKPYYNGIPDRLRDGILNHGHLSAYNHPLLFQFLIAAGFKYGKNQTDIKLTEREDLDGHWRACMSNPDVMKLPEAQREAAAKALDDNHTTRVNAWKM